MAAVIAPVTDEEHQELARLVLRAFSSSLFHQRIFGKVDPATHIQFLAAQSRSALQDPHCEMAKATRDGKIVGFVRWITPKDANAHAQQKGDEATSTSSQDSRYPPGSNVELARELLEVPEKEILEPDFRIGKLAVDPGAQGARVGSALLRHVCGQADEQGVAVYLRASAEALSLYRRFGFRQHGEPHRAASDPELALYPMLRKPVELVPATVRDLAVLAPIHRRAFAPMPVTRFLYTNVQPAPAVHEQFFQFAFGYVLAGAQARPDGGSVMTVARQGNQTLGSAWSTREPAAQDRPPATNQSQGSNIPGADPVRVRELYGTLEQHSRSIPFAHWNLRTMSVDPDAQGAGVGKRLLRSVMEKAASEGLPVVLESEEERLPLYLSAGFELFGDALVLVAAEDSTVKLWPMVLKTQKASDSEAQS